MSNRRAVVVLAAVVAFGFLTAVSAKWARGEGQERSAVILHFWRTSEDTGKTAEMVDLTIPLVDKQCPEGFVPTDDPGYCGRNVTVWVSLYYGGEKLNREKMQLRYRRSESGYVEPHVMMFPGLREIEVEPFYDASGLFHRIIGTLVLGFDPEKNVWQVRRREAGKTFFAETERGLPFLRMLECVIGEESRRASL